MRLSKLAFALAALGSTLVALAAGCEGTVQVGGKDPNCPATFPDGQACSDTALECTYEAAGCNIVYTCDGESWGAPSSACAAACMSGSPGSACLAVGETCGVGADCHHEEWSCLPDHTWDVWYDDGGPDCCWGECGCDPSYCAAEPPAVGSDCDPCFDSAYCEYVVVDACGEQPVVLVCSGDFTWQYLDAPGPCGCGAHTTIEECEADAGCRYLTGGCDAPSLEQSGCYPVDDCSPDMPCPDGTACAQVNANFCTLDPCIECGAVSVCL